MSYVTLNPETRRMTIPDEYKHFGVESDEKSKRIEFRFPRFVDDIDLNDFNLYINYSNANNEKGLCVAEDVNVSEDAITFAWVLSRHVTEYKGNVNFIVCAKKSFGDFRVQNEWNTRIATADVEQGLEVHHLVESMSSDSINKILSDISLLKPQVEANTLARHTHPNKVILDRLSDDFGLNYMGSKLATVDYVNTELDELPEFLGVYDEVGDLPRLANENSVALVVGKLSSEPSSISFMRYEYGSWVKINTITLISNDGIAALNSGVTEEKVNSYDDALDELDSISECIPTTASVDNLLATESYVNESVSTNTAYFRGSFNSVEELEAYSGDVTNNDYAYVIIRDDADSSIVKSIVRYKYAINQWKYEFELSLHDLTPAQIAALLSGITAEKVLAYDEIVSNVDGYASQNGIPTFNGNNIALEKVDDVVPLPFGEPVNLIFNPGDVESIPIPIISSNVEQGLDGCYIEVHFVDTNDFVFLDANHKKFEFGYSVETEPGTFSTTKYSEGLWIKDGESVAPPVVNGVIISDINLEGIEQYSSAEEIESAREEVRTAFRQLCQIVNTSVSNMGSIGKAEFVQVLKPNCPLMYGASYFVHLDEPTYGIDVYSDNIAKVRDDYAVVYMQCDEDVDLWTNAEFCTNGEAPNTSAGLHKLIFNYFHEFCSVGSLDLEAIE